jgi:hypothetical protein
MMIENFIFCAQIPDTTSNWFLFFTSISNTEVLLIC